MVESLNKDINVREGNGEKNIVMVEKTEENYPNFKVY